MVSEAEGRRFKSCRARHEFKGLRRCRGPFLYSSAQEDVANRMAMGIVDLLEA